MLSCTGLLFSFFSLRDGAVLYLLALGTSDTAMLSRSVSLLLLSFCGRRLFNYFFSHQST